jgi:hypothetical protein
MAVTKSGIATHLSGARNDKREFVELLRFVEFVGFIEFIALVEFVEFAEIDRDSLRQMETRGDSLRLIETNGDRWKLAGRWRLVEIDGDLNLRIPIRARRSRDT